uniref:Uncharacterized protein n=1 Tax=Cacopsylla melanoneura TaxID=428564 RepID=A0A8D8RZ35_9HEMI
MLTIGIQCLSTNPDIPMEGWLTAAERDKTPKKLPKLMLIYKRSRQTSLINSRTPCTEALTLMVLNFHRRILFFLFSFSSLSLLLFLPFSLSFFLCTIGKNVYSFIYFMFNRKEHLFIRY